MLPEAAKRATQEIYGKTDGNAPVPMNKGFKQRRFLSESGCKGRGFIRNRQNYLQVFSKFFRDLLYLRWNTRSYEGKEMAGEGGKGKNVHIILLQLQKRQGNGKLYNATNNLSYIPMEAN